MSGHHKGKKLNSATINRQVNAAEYAVRGEIPIRAEQLATELKQNAASLPFKQITRCNIGNPQELQQKPLTFFRQICALLEYDDLLHERNHAHVASLFPADAIARARSMRANIASMGAYTHSQGLKFIRDNVANFITARDNVGPADPNDIFLTNGASDGVKTAMQMLIQNRNSGIMIPIPQYPLYSATLSLLDGTPVPYYLDEEKGWDLSIDELSRSIAEARAQNVDVRALVVINPGNPTGGVLSMESMRGIVELCHREHLVLLADEVYQTNVYQDQRPFVSFRKVLKSMGPEFSNVELISFHSVSKGFIGECGKRGGYMEMIGIDAYVREQIYKVASISLCPNVQGQVIVDLMVNPPKEGEPSYELYARERDQILGSLKDRSLFLVDTFNKMEGVTCQPAQGAMYTFPQIRLPKKAVEAAKAAGKAPDSFYCMALLEATGVSVVPGTGFKQREGTYHFRCTFLPPQDTFPAFTDAIVRFHNEFMAKYKD
ncbi:alanine aminotransferase [Capsaspora owczarzaki ATCC 30864]|nr:alanine aminotransferase [Capsaspora owczarzaki ATCC 30864]|eukprot:XP_004345426.2 alanine aminotransferase [Capsaspora owczarzaki ATCC 30864]